MVLSVCAQSIVVVSRKGLPKEYGKVTRIGYYCDWELRTVISVTAGCWLT